MVMIAWNPLGFHVVASLPKGRTSNPEYYRHHILAAPIVLSPETGGRKIILHADNASASIAQKC
jgi:hypothetical protein